MEAGVDGYGIVIDAMEPVHVFQLQVGHGREEEVTRFDQTNCVFRQLLEVTIVNPNGDLGVEVGDGHLFRVSVPHLRFLSPLGFEFDHKIFVPVDEFFVAAELCLGMRNDP